MQAVENAHWILTAKVEPLVTSRSPASACQATHESSTKSVETHSRIHVDVGPQPPRQSSG